MIQRAEVVALIEQAVQAVPGSAEGLALGDIEGWDSMGMVIFIELVVKKTAAQLAIHDVRACAGLDELVELIRRSEAP